MHETITKSREAFKRKNIFNAALTMPIYSIIIPHYNIPDLLMRCLASIPVDERIQVIVVDDCSPDAATYKERFPELSRPYLEMYSTPIGGGSAGRARNVGIEHAKGKWLLFIDADDLFADNMLDIISAHKDSEADMLIFDFCAVMNEDLTKPSGRASTHENIRKKFMADSSDMYYARYCYSVFWGKMIRRSLIERHHIRCDEIRWSNDCMFTLKAGHYASKILPVNKLLYILTERNDSLANSYVTKKTSLEEYLTRCNVDLNILEFLNQHNVRYPSVSFSNFRFFMHRYHGDFLIFMTKVFCKHPIFSLRFLCFLAREKWNYISKR